MNDQVIGWVDRLEKLGLVEKKFNTGFFTNGDSREPELEGIGGAAAGSGRTLIEKSGKASSTLTTPERQPSVRSS